MSNIEIITNEKNEKVKGKLLDGTFCYIKLQSGDWKYQSKTEKEYSLDIVVDKATAKAFKKEFPKNGYKEIDTSEFEGKYKIAPPFPDEDEQFVIKLKADAQLSADAPKAGLSKGDELPYEWNTRPKLFVPVEGGVEDVTMTVLAANGSKGDIAFNITTNDFGSFPKLTGVLVKELIEYSPEGGNKSDFGEVVGGLNKGSGEVQQKPQESAGSSQSDDSSNQGGSASKGDKSSPVNSQDGTQGSGVSFDDDIPFNRLGKEYMF